LLFDRAGHAPASRLMSSVRSSIRHILPEVENWVIKCRYIEVDYFLREIEILEQNRQLKGNTDATA